MKRIGSYRNGNYYVTIFDDGTKLRSNDLDFFAPEKPESMDIKITDQCDIGCAFCHENSTPNGRHGDILNAPFLDTLLPYTELAIGGGNPLAHPDLIKFLEQLKARNLIANMTVHQCHFMENFDKIKSLSDAGLVYGIGVSVTAVNDNLIKHLQAIPNVVLHVINGVIDVSVLQHLAGRGLKILILGYKEFRRGAVYYDPTVEVRKGALYQALPDLVEQFEVISFDNLAIKQLDVKRLLSEKEWLEFYMGDDGQYTMYVDMVNREFAKSSTSRQRWPLEDDIKTMFAMVNVPPRGGKT